MDKYKALEVKSSNEMVQVEEKEWDNKTDMLSHYRKPANFQETDNILLIEWRQYKAIENFILDKIMAGRVTKLQTFKDGTLVNFNNKGRWVEVKDLATQKYWVEYHGRVARVLSLATYHNLGDKNSEYYDIEFMDGMVLYAVSGFHLENNNEDT